MELSLSISAGGTSPAGPRSAALFRMLLPGTIAAGVVACFASTAEDSPLPAFGWAAAFLAVAIHEDVRALRIPNWLTLPGLVLALGVAAIGGAGPALGALAGAGCALALLFVPFALRWLGAGDVKALMVLGALWGAPNLVAALFWMLLAGGAIAIAWIAAQGGLTDLLHRWALSAKHSVLSLRIVYFRPDAGSPAASGLPFAVAMGLGAAAFQHWGSPWI